MSAPTIDESEPNDTPASANVLPLAATVHGTIDRPVDVDSFRLDIPERGLLELGIHRQSGQDLVLALLDSAGRLLIESESGSGVNPNQVLSQHVPPGTYFVATSAAGTGNVPGPYELALNFRPTTSPGERIALPGQPDALAIADLNGDGRLDFVAAASQSFDSSAVAAVFFGTGDGTFATAQDYPIGPGPAALAVVDISGDGRPDIVTSGAEFGQPGTVSVLLNRGDGTFAPETRWQVGGGPNVLATADLNGDGRPDLITANANSSDVSVLLNQGGGVFLPLRTPIVDSPNSLAIADFNGDGLPDLATANNVSFRGQGTIAILVGNGDGTFGFRTLMAVGDSPADLDTGDFNHDGRTDLIFVKNDASTIHVLLGQGDGTFALQPPLPTGAGPADLVVADLNGDGHDDLVTANQTAGDLSVYLGLGNGHFVAVPGVAGMPSPNDLTVADFNTDGRADLTVLSLFADQADILLGMGDGAFTLVQSLRTASGPVSLLVADLDGTAGSDLLIGSFYSSTATVYSGNGDGSFRVTERAGVGEGPVSFTSADFDRDGRTDVATANVGSDDVTVLLGRGDGSFASSRRIAVGDTPLAVVAADFNRDGRADLATVNRGSFENGYVGTVSILLGLGDGTFAAEVRLAAGVTPTRLAVLDLNRDRKADLAIVDQAPALLVRLGNGDGTFLDEQRFPTGVNPGSLLTVDLDGDGSVDLVTVNQRSGDVSLLTNDGRGGFTERRLAVIAEPTDALAGDFNGDGRVDLLVTSQDRSDASVLFNRGAGTFDSTIVRGLATWEGEVVLDVNGDGRSDWIAIDRTDGIAKMLLAQPNETFSSALPLGDVPYSAIVSGDFNADGRTDLAFADSNNQRIAIYLATGDSLQAAGTFVSGVAPASLYTTDVNDDGRLDVVAIDATSRTLATLLGVGAGAFVDGSTSGFGTATGTPRLGDVDGDAFPDAIVVDAAGAVFLRRGRPEAPGTFEPPLIVNLDADERTLVPALDAAILYLPDAAGVQRALVATIEKDADRIAFWMLGTDNVARQIGTLDFSPGTRPTRLAAGDLNRDGRDDLVVVHAGARSASIFFGSAAGLLELRANLPVGAGPAEIALGDLDDNGLVDVMVVGAASGDVTVLRQQTAGQFDQHRFKAGTGPYEFAKDARGNLALLSQLQTSSIASVDANQDGLFDAAVVNAGAHALFWLPGTTAGGFLDPVFGLSLPIASAGAIVRAADFNADTIGDLAVLFPETQSVAVYLGTPGGGFRTASSTDAGNRPTGLTAADVDGDRIVDLVIGNEFGDLLILRGNGDGSFQPFQRAGSNMALAVTDLDGDGKDDFIFANERFDRVTVRYSQSSTDVVTDRQQGILAPGSVQLVDLDQDGRKDLVVTNSGGNSVLVYRGLAGGQFDVAQSFAVGTNPVQATAHDFNGDGRLDLAVANAGSDYVSILLGDLDANQRWTMTPRVQVQAGFGPVSVNVLDGNGDGIDDLVVTNAQEGTARLLPGIRDGFFNDVDPPAEILVGPTSNQGGIVAGGNWFVANPLTNTITMIVGIASAFLDFDPASRLRTFASGGERPVWVQAADLDFDGAVELIVANNGDGLVTLLSGGRDGFAVFDILADEGLFFPTALALARDSDGDWLLYTVSEGDENVFVFELAVKGVPSDNEDAVALPLGRELDPSALPGLETALAQLSKILLAALPGSDRADADTSTEVTTRDFSDTSAAAEVVALLKTLAGGWGQLVDTVETQLADWLGLSEKPRTGELAGPVVGLVRLLMPTAVGTALASSFDLLEAIAAAPELTLPADASPPPSADDHTVAATATPSSQGTHADRAVVLAPCRVDDFLATLPAVGDCLLADFDFAPMALPVIATGLGAWTRQRGPHGRVRKPDRRLPI